MKLYEGVNTLPHNERIEKSKFVERWMLGTINRYGIKVKNACVKGWIHCNEYDDKKKKRDIYAYNDRKIIYGQMKFRQPGSGNDIGFAVIQPYPGKKALKECVGNPKQEEYFSSIVARDVKFDGVTYVVLDGSWTKLVVIPYDLVKKASIRILREWIDSDVELNYSSRTFRSKLYDNAELKWKRDSGRAGYDANVEKLLVYIPINYFLKNDRVQLLDMIDHMPYFSKDCRA